MIKKVVLILFMFLVMSVYADAQRVELDGPSWLNVLLSNPTGDQTIVIVPVTTIYPKDRVLGYSIIPTGVAASSDHTECYLTLYEGTTKDTDLALNEIINEAEAKSGEGKNEWFIYPYTVIGGVIAGQGAHTDAQIYFVH